jgi:pyrimidine-nucleoside phosphorylase
MNSTHFLPAELIKKKRDGLALSADEIRFFINAYTDGTIPDYQMSALLMAIFFKDCTDEETLALTESMLHSGSIIDLSFIAQKKVDKHSTGGVGDKTSLILGPIVAAAGVPVPMISGRGLGHTGGTLDKLESIPGFNTQLSLDVFKQSVQKNKICFIGQTKDICPADKKIYALRDVTATVESLPLICASIMSKKLAEGIDALVLDVKFGSGAFMKTPQKAEELAIKLMAIAEGAGKKCTALLTNMDQPLGRFAGNSVEVEECLSILKNETHDDPRRASHHNETRELSLWLSAHMIYLGEAAKDLKSAYALAESMLTSGKAYEKFEELCHIHKGRLNELPQPKNKKNIFSESDGYIKSFNTESLGLAGILLKAGRAKTSDLIEPTAGIEFQVKVGDQVKKGDVLYTLYGADPALFEHAESQLKSSITFSEKRTEKQNLILKTLGRGANI